HCKSEVAIRLATVHVGICGGQNDRVRTEVRNDPIYGAGIADVDIFGSKGLNVLALPRSHQVLPEQAGGAEGGAFHSEQAIRRFQLAKTECPCGLSRK